MGSRQGRTERGRARITFRACSSSVRRPDHRAPRRPADLWRLRIRTLGMVEGVTLHCVYTQRGGVRRIIAFAMRTGRSEMPIVRRTRADIDKAKLLADLAARPRPTEDEIERQAAEDGDAWTDQELAEAESVYPPPSPAQVRALRAKLGLSQAQFARRFGFTLDTVQQYEQGRRRPSGPASTLLRVIEADPEAVVRALGLRKAG